MPRDDRTLVTRARNGDVSAFAQLLARYDRRLLRACQGVLGDADACADVAQDAALVAWLQLDRLRDADRFGAWLAGIGRVLSLRVRRAAPSPLDVTNGDRSEQAADERDEPLARVLAAERSNELAAAIASLPPGQRDAVVLFHLAELPQTEVALRLSTRQGAVSTRLHKARAALRAHLERSEPPMSYPATIRDVVRTPAGRHVVILTTADDELPIWIGMPEAEALVAELHGVEMPRPHAHALALSLLAACGRKAVAVRICRLEHAIFYAEVVLDDGTAVDARPSDALVLAAADRLPITLDRAVLDAAAASPSDDLNADLAQAEDRAPLLADELRSQMHTLAEDLKRLR
jgi:RNA polymerase sigma factor (sigma-70 family)